jgi:hypothetical protein
VSIWEKFVGWINKGETEDTPNDECEQAGSRKKQELDIAQRQVHRLEAEADVKETMAEGYREVGLDGKAERISSEAEVLRERRQLAKRKASLIESDLHNMRKDS